MKQHIPPPREVAPDQVHEVLGRHVLADGFRLVYDTRASRGSWVVDARSGERYLDLYTFFASAPLGSNPRGPAPRRSPSTGPATGGCSRTRPGRRPSCASSGPRWPDSARSEAALCT